MNPARRPELRNDSGDGSKVEHRRVGKRGDGGEVIGVHEARKMGEVMLNAGRSMRGGVA